MLLHCNVVCSSLADEVLIDFHGGDVYAFNNNSAIVAVLAAPLVAANISPHQSLVLDPLGVAGMIMGQRA